jgi:hypothetical protein
MDFDFDYGDFLRWQQEHPAPRIVTWVDLLEDGWVVWRP